MLYFLLFSFVVTVHCFAPVHHEVYHYDPSLRGEFFDDQGNHMTQTKANDDDTIDQQVLETQEDYEDIDQEYQEPQENELEFTEEDHWNHQQEWPADKYLSNQNMV